MLCKVISFDHFLFLRTHQSDPSALERQSYSVLHVQTQEERYNDGKKVTTCGMHHKMRAVRLMRKNDE